MLRRIRTLFTCSSSQGLETCDKEEVRSRWIEEDVTIVEEVKEEKFGLVTIEETRKDVKTKSSPGSTGAAQLFLSSSFGPFIML